MANSTQIYAEVVQEVGKDYILPSTIFVLVVGGVFI
jgi:hypothetical protein